MHVLFSIPASRPVYVHMCVVVASAVPEAPSPTSASTSRDHHGQIVFHPTRFPLLLHLWSLWLPLTVAHKVSHQASTSTSRSTAAGGIDYHSVLWRSVHALCHATPIVRLLVLYLVAEHTSGPAEETFFQNYISGEGSNNSRKKISLDSCVRIDMSTGLQQQVPSVAAASTVGNSAKGPKVTSTAGGVQNADWTQKRPLWQLHEQHTTCLDVTDAFHTLLATNTKTATRSIAVPQKTASSSTSDGSFFGAISSLFGVRYSFLA